MARGRRSHSALIEFRVREVENACFNIRLQGLLPICCYCKRIRDDSNYWQSVESCISEHTAAQSSHGICPQCFEGVAGVLLLHQTCAARTRFRARGPLAVPPTSSWTCNFRVAVSSPGVVTSTALAATPARSNTSPQS